MSWAKALATTPEYILHEISYANLLLYGKATPDYSIKPDKKEREWDESLNADNPANTSDDTPDRIRI